MFENTSLQELYTGSLIAGKGKLLNNIRVIMERLRFRNEDWARVRFGAGTPWRRCWCVIDPPNEKEFQKEQKSLKKRSAYERPPVLKGDIKFYDTKKTKKTTPIATITDAYSAYAIYPQSKPLIDQSTLVKVEGRITIHSNPESQSEGFVFVMPEVHPAVSGFEMMLRWLFPVYDIFGLYGRPARLIADTLDNRGLMFAMPKERRYGYLDIQDVAALVCTEGSENWSEQEWRKQMKDVTSRRLSSTESRTTSRTTSRQGSRKGVRTSLPAGISLRYEDGASVRSSPSQRHKYNQSTDTVFATPQKNRTPHQIGSLTSANYHARSASDTLAFANSPRKRQEQHVPSRLSVDQEREIVDKPPPPPVHGRLVRKGRPEQIEVPKAQMTLDNDAQPPMLRESDEVGSDLRPQPPPTPVAAPPAFLHSPGERPSLRPNASPELRRENSRMSITTLSQLVDASKSGTALGDPVAVAGAASAWRSNESSRGQGQGYKGVNEITDRRENPADQRHPQPGLVAGLKHDELTAPEASRSERQNEASSHRPDEISRSSADKSMTRKPVPPTEATVSSTLNVEERAPNEGYTKTDIIAGRFPSVGGNQPAEEQVSQDVNTSVENASSQELSTKKRPDRSILKPRSRGILKSNGDLNLEKITSQNLKAKVPNAHFATTKDDSLGNRNASEAVGTSNSPRLDHARTPLDSLTAKEERRSSYLGNSSPSSGSNSRSHSYSPHPGERVVQWQPGGASVGPGPKSLGSRISPEEFVQQRAHANRVVSPVYAHQRTRSSGNIMPERSTSAMSGDWTKRKEVGSRPSTGEKPGVIPQQQDYTSHLSAREQEHVARMTNSPLVNVNANRHQSPPASAGLVGAIEAREQEKKQFRQGISGQMMQNAIAQRQQQAQQQYQTYQQQMALQQAQQQAISPQAQAYQAQIAAGFLHSSLHRAGARRLVLEVGACKQVVNGRTHRLRRTGEMRSLRRAQEDNNRSLNCRQIQGTQPLDQNNGDGVSG